MSTQSTSGYGSVKQVTSGDTVVIRALRKGPNGPPKEKTIVFSSIVAPKLGKRAIGNSDETKDEPWAWEAREFLRKKIIGETVYFTIEKSPSESREYGTIYIGKDVASGENVTELLISEGLVSVKKENVRQLPELVRLIELEDHAKTAGKGKWGSDNNSQDHVRNIKWSVDNMRNFVDKLNGKPVPAVVEHVRDGSTIRCFLLPDFYHITLMISGIRCPGFKLDADGRPDLDVVVPYAEEARYFVETHLLQRDVEVVLESVNNNNFVGSIIHPKGNIATLLLLEGFARCVDWSMAFMKSGVDKLRAAEKTAKENKKRLWKDYVPASTPEILEKEFTGVVTEIINGDALMVKLPNGITKKVFLASIRPPRDQRGEGGDALPVRSKMASMRLYDIPWLYEAREFLRKKLIGKKVHVVVDYIQPPREAFAEKLCCTVTISGVNVAETLVSRGLATVQRYRQDDDQRSSHYDALLAAENQALKGGKGVHAKKDIPTHRVQDCSGDVAKSKLMFPHLSRNKRVEALVEFITSGSRLRLMLPKESCLITFLLAGISCPRGVRPGDTNGKAEPFSEEALTFTKDKCMQREVEVQFDSVDKIGNFIGWLFVENQNLSVALVEEGLASVHPSAERSEYYRTLTNAEKVAKDKRTKIWKDYKEEEENEKKKKEEDVIIERKLDQQKVVIVETTPELHIFAQLVDQGPKLESLLDKMRQELKANPPLQGAYTPKRGDMCAAKFVEDGLWYRVKVEKLSGGNVTVYYLDYGNRDTIPVSQTASLPAGFAADEPYAKEYGLACVQLPHLDYQKDAVDETKGDLNNRTVLLNVEYQVGNLGYVTLVDPATQDDIIKSLIKDGVLMVEKRKERRLQKLVDEYLQVQGEAKKAHCGMWIYGDCTQDEDKEFGLGR